MSKKVVDVKSVERVLHYVRDMREGELIERTNYCKDYLGVKSPIAQWELDLICEMFNKYILLPEEHMYNHMGEIIFSTKQEKE